MADYKICDSSNKDRFFFFLGAINTRPDVKPWNSERTKVGGAVDNKNTGSGNK